jgi:hypothetical protein
VRRRPTALCSAFNADSTRWRTRGFCGSSVISLPFGCVGATRPHLGSHYRVGADSFAPASLPRCIGSGYIGVPLPDGCCGGPMDTSFGPRQHRWSAPTGPLQHRDSVFRSISAPKALTPVAMIRCVLETPTSATL